MRSLDGVETKIETAVSGKTAVLGKVQKHFGWAKARRQAPPLPHGSYATEISAPSIYNYGFTIFI